MKHTKAYITSGLLLIAALFSALPSYADAVITDAEYYIKEDVSSNSGTITATLVDGSWQIEAVPSNPEKWRFDHWNDLSSSDPNYRENPRTISLNKLVADQSISATFQYFVWQGCYSPEEMLGIVTSYDEVNTYGHINATEVAGVWYAEAVPESSAYTFAQWSDGSFVNPRVFDPTLIGSDALYATFIPTATKGLIDSWSKDGFILKTTYAEGSLTDEGAVTVFFDGQLMSSELPGNFDYGVAEVAATYNSAYAGKTCHIVYKDGSCEPVATLDVTIPVLVDGEEEVEVPNTSTGVHVLEGGVATLAADQTIADLDIYAGGKAIISGDVVASSVTMRADGPLFLTVPVPDMLVTGSLTNNNSNIINFDYALDYYYYYPFSLPYTVNTADATYRSGADAADHFALNYYDGNARANGGTTWKAYYDHAEGGAKEGLHFDLEAGKGYNIFSESEFWNPADAATYAETGDPGTFQEMYGGIIRFPMTVNLSTGGEPVKSIPVTAYGTDAVHKSNRNWNLIGLPYLSSYDGSITLYHNDDPILDEEGDPKTLTYITVPSNSFTDYDAERVEDIVLLPFQAYFIQFEGSDVNKLVFESPNPAARAAAPKKRKAKAETNMDIKAGIILNHADKSDHTGLLIGDNYTANYDVNADLAKMIGKSSRVKLYSLNGSQKLAYTALPTANGSGILETIIPLGYESATVGQEMTFAFDEMRYAVDENISELNLIDNVEGVSVNLLDEPYTCTAIEKADNTRFALGVRYTKRAPQIATDICDIDAEVSTLNDGVYDLLGRRISADSRTLRTGVYIIIENGQARKEVIR